MSYTGKKPIDVVDATTAQTLTIEEDIVTPSINGGQIGGRRNLIINGAMRVAQRGTSSTSDGYATVDRMRKSSSSLATAVTTAEQSTDAPDGFSYSYKVTTSTAEGAVNADDIYYPLNYRIEAQDLQHLKYGTSDAETVTVSFWVKSSVAGTYVLQLFGNDNSRMAGRTYSISSADTWEYKTLTYGGDTTDGINNDTGIGLELYFIAGAGSNFTSGTLAFDFEDFTNANWAVGQSVNLQNTENATFQVTGLQLEVGSTATEFEHCSYGEELQLCQRYYEENTSVEEFYQLPSASASQVQRQTVGYATPKRANGTLTVTRNAAASTAGTVVAAYLLGTSSFMVYFTGSQYNVVWYDWAIDAEL